MQRVFLIVSVVQFVLLLGGIVLLFRRHSRVDRIMVTQLLTTLCVSLLLTLGEGLARPELCDVALVLTLLAVITTIAFVRVDEASEETRTP